MGAHLRRGERLTSAWMMGMTEYPAGYTCEVVALRLDRYVAGALPRADALAVAEHLEACAWCIERLMLLRVGGGNHESRGED